jgi:hypothetical protein
VQVYLVFGCNGFQDDDGFISCHGVANPILDLSKIPKETRVKVIKFLDEVCELFDKPIYDTNYCSNVIGILYRDHGVISEETLHKIQAFLQMHKICGLYMMLMFKEDYVHVGRQKSKDARKPLPKESKK